jgi:hypothetical protein
MCGAWTLFTAPGAALDGAMQSSVPVGVGPVSFVDLVAVARHGAGVDLAPDAVAAIDRAREVVEALAAAATPAYGISTGFGALATRHIPTEMRAQLQKSLVRSHAAGSGPEVEREVVRALMLLRLSRSRPGTPASAPRPHGCSRRCSRTASPRWCGSTARWDVRETWRRWRTAPSR